MNKKSWILLIVGCLLTATFFLAPIGIFLIIWVTIKTIKKYKKYKPIINLEQEIEEKEKEKSKINDDIQNEIKNQQNLKEHKTKLKKELFDLNEQNELMECGYYEPKYEFDDCISYETKLKDIKYFQKDMIKKKQATEQLNDWTVNGSTAQGRKFTNNFSKLILRAFNGECDGAIAKVKYNNINTMEKRIDKSYEQINKLSNVTGCKISSGYLLLKKKELYLMNDFAQFKQDEKAEQQRIKQEMREEQRAIKEIEKARVNAEKEEVRYQKALEKAREEIKNSTGKKLDTLKNKIIELEQKFKEAQELKQRAISRAQLTRSGFVYVISNIGSFGENIYKIGMTRRLEPMDRIKELSSASVPFPFDVHAMIYSKDAPKLENTLHKVFYDSRVNKVNDHKEFFDTNLNEIKKAVTKYTDGEIKFTLLAEAKEYKMSLSKEKKKAS